jgi:hypothetical protein
MQLAGDLIDCIAFRSKVRGDKGLSGGDPQRSGADCLGNCDCGIFSKLLRYGRALPGVVGVELALGDFTAADRADFRRRLPVL